MRRAVLFAFLLAVIVPIVPAVAAAPAPGTAETVVVPGDFCAVTDLNKVYQGGGKDTDGAVHLMVCDGYNWKSLNSWQLVNKVARAGIGVDTPREALEVNGNIAMTSANATLKDAGGYLGIAFKNVTMMAIANIVQIVAPIRIDSFLSFNPGAYALFPGGGIWDAKGQVGIGTTTPRATLDVNGVLKLKVNDHEPAKCGPGMQGSIAMTREARMCACNSAGTWVDLNSEAVCQW